MAVNEAIRDLREKLKLEKSFREEIAAFNKRVVRKFTRQLGREGIVLNADEFNEELEGILDKHYARVGQEFDNSIQLPEDVAETEDERKEILAALLLLYALRVETQARIITATTQRNASDAARAGLQFRIDSEEPVSALEAATVAGATLDRSLRGRQEGIVVLETQAPAELAKTVQAEVLLGVFGAAVAVGPAEQATKEWVTVGDVDVRDIHEAADGQEKQVLQPFIVGGELLDYPGDTSLGASVGNVINCRCSSVHDRQKIIDTRRQG